MTRQIVMAPVAFVQNSRTSQTDDFWGGVLSEIILAEGIPAESLAGLDAFSHVEVLFYFDSLGASGESPMARHPRGNLNWPKVGIFAQRNKDRPNRIGLTIARIVKCGDRQLLVEGLDAVDGTPVLDIKPVMVEYLPAGPVRQPDWSHELMTDYWSKGE